VLVTTVSLYVTVVARIGNGAADTSRECGAGPFEASAQFFPLSSTRWPFLRCIPSAGVRGSLASHCLQRSDSTSLMTCSRSLVGTVSCNTMYHMDVISSDTQTVRRFFHTYINCVSACICFIIYLDSLVTAAIVCRVF